MVDILAFDCGLAFALSDLSASFVSRCAVINLVRLALVPVVFLLVVARIGRQLLASLALAWLGPGKTKVVGEPSSGNKPAGD